MSQRFLVLFSIALSLIAASFPEYPVKAAADYPNVVTKAGLSVAAFAVEDTEEQRKYFGADLTWKSYLPVFLVIENHSPGDSFLVAKEGLMYGPAGRSGSALADPSRPTKSDKTLNVLSVVPDLGFMAALAFSRSTEVRQNILKKELESATLSPGTSVHGFVFIPLHSQHTVRDKIHLSIPLTESGTGATVVLDLEL